MEEGTQVQTGASHIEHASREYRDWNFPQMLDRRLEVSVCELSLWYLSEGEERS